MENGEPTSSQNIRYNYRGEHVQETPTHHELDSEELQTWVYPTNIGEPRQYQFAIVKSSLFNNTLVALPTGLGKTLIAATVMLNFFRWTKNAKIVFVAPTKPLVSQQVDACFHIAGIPRSETTLLTGEIAPGLRAEEWQSKRVFFMTPQTLQNDLSNGMADPKSIVLLVIDEAHRSTGEYAYVKVVKFMRRFNQSFRILALTATPGSTIEGVQDIIDNLGISHIEIRTEDSLDLRQYVHKRSIDQILVDPSDEMHEIKDLFTKALKPLTDKLSQQNIYWGRDPMLISTFGLLQKRNEWMRGQARNLPQGVKFMISSIFSILQGLAHAIKLLNFHGIRPFYVNLKTFRDEVDQSGTKKGGSKWKQQVISDPSFRDMMKKLEVWLRRDDFISHPKISHLCDTVLNHFMDHSETSVAAPDVATGTRVIVFSEYRDSAEDIVKILNRHRPLVRASVFVGQANSQRSEGMNQKAQLETIEQFKTGDLNVLVATSIGEEGLDIGQVDLIICYDASASPIRMLQRMGRTGRKRAGNIVMLLMRGKEQENFEKAKDNYIKMQALICEGSRFEFRYDLSRRIVPLDAYRTIQVDKRHVEIPIENTQNPDMPEPRKRGRKPKRPPKKFHMPENVETGFQNASGLGQPGIKSAFAKAHAQIARASPWDIDFTVEVPSLHSVLLSKAEHAEFRRLYKDVPGGIVDTEYVDDINLAAYPRRQRVLQKTFLVGHGTYTKRCVKMLEMVARIGQSGESRYKANRDRDTSNWKTIPCPHLAEDNEDDGSSGKGFQPAFCIAKQCEVLERSYGLPPKRTFSISFDSDKEEEVVIIAPMKKRGRPSKTTAISIGNRIKPGASRVQSTKQAKAAARKHISADFGRTKAKKATSTSKRSRVNDAGEDYGDSCMRSDDLLLSSDGSDCGSDLEDFVVQDDVASSQLRAQDDMTSSLLSIGSSFPRKQDKTNHIVTYDLSSDEPDEELPSLSQALAETDLQSKSRGNPESTKRDGNTKDGKASRRKRTTVWDSDDEYD